MNVSEINTIKKMKVHGFEGVDFNLETSLFEYGIAWKVSEKETEFVYGIQLDTYNGESLYSAFDRCSFDNDLDVRAEFDWVAFDEVLSYTGSTPDEFDAFPLTQKIADLVSYYGYEEIFGSSYWNGFEIKAI